MDGFLSDEERDMNKGTMRGMACGLVLAAAAVPFAAFAAPAFTGPVELRVDNLKTPLGSTILRRGFRGSCRTRREARSRVRTRYGCFARRTAAPRQGGRLG